MAPKSKIVQLVKAYEMGTFLALCGDGSVWKYEYDEKAGGWVFEMLEEMRDGKYLDA